MLTTSYPKYPGETTAPFIEEIAAGLARRGHSVHVVAPFHRDVRRAPIERGVHLHFFRYSPWRTLNVWGYAEALRADVGLRGRALLAAPLALGASVGALLRLTAVPRTENQEPRTGQREQRTENKEQIAGRAQAPGITQYATRNTQPNSQFSILNSQFTSFDVIHAHWVLPNGPPAALAARLRGLPLVISLHGSDIYLAERAVSLSLAAAGDLHCAPRGKAGGRHLRQRALRPGAGGGVRDHIPYGLEPRAFHPDPAAGAHVRAELGLAPGAPLIVTVSRLVYKKGLTYLLQAFPRILERHPGAALVIAGYGDQ